MSEDGLFPFLVGDTADGRPAVGHLLEQQHFLLALADLDSQNPEIVYAGPAPGLLKG
ncbi:MAG TPA: hypothetical protein VKE74_29120 [Gemmataceae bacterium]|nr:hypothetical protein [Gemmataceae bacterium]